MEMGVGSSITVAGGPWNFPATHAMHIHELKTSRNTHIPRKDSWPANITAHDSWCLTATLNFGGRKSLVTCRLWSTPDFRRLNEKSILSKQTSKTPLVAIPKQQSSCLETDSSHLPDRTGPPKRNHGLFHPHNLLKWILGTVHSQNLTWQRKIRFFNRGRIFKCCIFHCHVSLQGGYPFTNLNKICKDFPRQKIDLLGGWTNPFDFFSTRMGSSSSGWKKMKPPHSSWFVINKLGGYIIPQYVN